MKAAIVTGGSRGIGLEFVRQLLEDGFQVVAASREAENVADLRRLAEASGEETLLIHRLDVGSGESRCDFFRFVSRQLDGVDYLINSAGILSGDEGTRTAFGSLDQSELSQTFLINAIAPLLMVQEAYPLLERGGRPVVANISSSNGSISKREGGGKYSYCASKAALNMITKILAADLREEGIITVALHPGWVRTRMTRSEPAPMEAVDSVKGMLQVLGDIDMGSSGKFLDWEGKTVPW